MLVSAHRSYLSQVNINKQKKEAFQILHPELEEDPVGDPFFDERVAFDKKKLVRPRRPTFQFVEEGKWSKEAEMQKLRVSNITWPFACLPFHSNPSVQVLHFVSFQAARCGGLVLY